MTEEIYTMIDLVDHIDIEDKIKEELYKNDIVKICKHHGILNRSQICIRKEKNVKSGFSMKCRSCLKEKNERWRHKKYGTKKSIISAYKKTSMEYL